MLKNINFLKITSFYVTLEFHFSTDCYKPNTSTKLEEKKKTTACIFD